MTVTLAAPPAPRLARLRVDHLEAPIGLARVSPGFSWRIDAPGLAGLAQAAWRIVVAEGASGRTVADSGVVASDACIAVIVPGFEGRHGSDYRWELQVWLAGHDAAGSGPSPAP